MIRIAISDYRPLGRLWREITGPPPVDFDYVRRCTAAKDVRQPRNQAASPFVARHHDTLVAGRICGLVGSLHPARTSSHLSRLVVTAS